MVCRGFNTTSTPSPQLEIPRFEPGLRRFERSTSQRNFRLDVAVFRDQRHIQSDQGWNMHAQTSIYQTREDIAVSSALRELNC